METNIERIREKLIQKEMAEVLRKVQDGEFTKEAKLWLPRRAGERKNGNFGGSLRWSMPGVWF